jgi:hypothetical protein
VFSVKQIPTKHILCSGNEKRKKLELCLACVADWLPCLHHRPLLNYVICSHIKRKCFKWHIIRHCAVWCYSLPAEHRTCGVRFPLGTWTYVYFPASLRVRGLHYPAVWRWKEGDGDITPVKNSFKNTDYLSLMGPPVLPLHLPPERGGRFSAWNAVGIQPGSRHAIRFVHLNASQANKAIRAKALTSRGCSYYRFSHYLG